MSKKIAQIGDRVFLPHLDQFGEVMEVLPGGTISRVKIKDPYSSNYNVIDTINMVVKIVHIVEGVIPALTFIFRQIFSWFGFKKRKKNDGDLPPPMSSAEINAVLI